MDDSATNFEAFQFWLSLRNYAAATQKSYASRLRRFLLWRRRTGKTGEIEAIEVRDYLAERSAESLAVTCAASASRTSG